MPTDCVLVWTTLPHGDAGNAGDAVDAASFATALVEERLAACVTVQAEMLSVYRWKGQVEHDRERQVVIKTTASRVDSLTRRIRQLHPYEVPEVLVVPIADGSDDYLTWVRESVSEERK